MTRDQKVIRAKYKYRTRGKENLRWFQIDEGR